SDPLPYPVPGDPQDDVHGDPDQADHDEYREDLVGLQEPPGADDPVPESGLGVDEFRDDHEVPRRRRVDPHRVEHSGQRVRYDDLPQYLAPARAQRVRHVDERPGHQAHGIGGHQRVEEDRTDEQDRHLRRLPDAQPDQQQRDERAGRQVAQQADDRLQERLPGLEAAHQDAQRYRDRHRQ